MTLYALGDLSPQLGEGAWAAPSADLIGDVRLGARASVWFGAVLRGDVGGIRVGKRSNIQDLACVHVTEGLSHTHVGDDVTVGHSAILHGCIVGDRCLIGKGSGIVGHFSIEIGDDVWTGHHVYITDQNHGYEDLERPISVQMMPEKPVRIGAGSWLGHGTVVLPGATIGRHVVVGANSVVRGELPDFCVAAGNPAKVIKLLGRPGPQGPAAVRRGPLDSDR